jgi:excisionase family DNA binding protein
VQTKATLGGAPPAAAPPRSYLTPRQFARQLGVDVGKVTRWCADGTLAAIDVAARPGGKRRRWRIPPAAVAAFEAARAPQPKTPRPRRNRRAEAGEMIDHWPD